MDNRLTFVRCLITNSIICYLFLLDCVACNKSISYMFYCLIIYLKWWRIYVITSIWLIRWMDLALRRILGRGSIVWMGFTHFVRCTPSSLVHRMWKDPPGKEESNLWKICLKKFGLSKIIVFSWRFLQNRVPTQ
jgi:hypothetical protein